MILNSTHRLYNLPYLQELDQQFLLRLVFCFYCDGAWRDMALFC